MGTYFYFYVRTKDTSDAGVHYVNEIIANLLPDNDYSKDFIISDKFLQEECYFFNHHPDGQQQLTQFARPITPQVLSNNFFWYEVGCGVFKVSSFEIKEQHEFAKTLQDWFKTDQAKQLIDFENSENLDYDLGFAEHQTNPTIKHATTEHTGGGVATTFIVLQDGTFLQIGNGMLWVYESERDYIDRNDPIFRTGDMGDAPYSNSKANTK